MLVLTFWFSVDNKRICSWTITYGYGLSYYVFNLYLYHGEKSIALWKQKHATCVGSAPLTLFLKLERQIRNGILSMIRKRERIDRWFNYLGFENEM